MNDGRAVKLVTSGLVRKFISCPKNQISLIDFQGKL